MAATDTSGSFTGYRTNLGTNAKDEDTALDGEYVPTDDNDEGDDHGDVETRPLPTQTN